MIAAALRALAVAVPAACGTFAVVASHSIVFGGLLWLGFLLAVLAGLGHGMAKLAGVRGDLGLRLVWGTAGLLTLSGPLLAAGVLHLYAYIGLLAAGFGLYAWRQVSEPEPALLVLGRKLVDGIRAHPGETLLFAALAVLAAVNILGAVPPHDTNVYDDDIAYTPMVRRLLEAGDLHEPFNFRRVCAYGGQTVLATLAAVRGTLANIYLVDHGLFFFVTLALVVGLLCRPGSDRFVGGLLLFVLLLLPDSSINTNSHWTGVALFLGLYRTLTDVRWSAKTLVLAGLLAGSACTLRQNYLPVAVGVLGLSLLAHSLRRRRLDRSLWIAALAGGLISLAGYWVAAWQSSRTWLYPLVLGTVNPDIPMAAPLFSGWQELEFFLTMLLTPDPWRITLALMPVLFLMRDRRPGAPMIALFAASVAGFILLVHSFTLSDAMNLWRYAFAYTMALTIVVVLESTRAGDLQLPSTARFWVIACLLVQLVATIKPVSRKFNTIGASLAAASRLVEPSEVERDYQSLQARVPAGAKIAVLLDEPAFLDYGRNEIFNLDFPGQVSPSPGLPNFRGAEAIAAYFRAQDIRHLAFVRGSHSRYFYRRDIWVTRLITDTELWHTYAPYFIDTLDSFEELASRYPVLFDKDGLVLLDLAPARSGR